MTHTLHPEIEEAIEKMIKDMELPAEVWAKLFIIQSLGKYLHMPQPIENEPVDRTVTRTITQKLKQYFLDIHHLVIDEHTVWGIVASHLIPVKDNEPLPENPFAPECPPWKIWDWRKFVDKEQSTPQIELPAYVLNNLDYLWLLLDKMIEKSKSHLDKLKSLDK